MDTSGFRYSVWWRSASRALAGLTLAAVVLLCAQVARAQPGAAAAAAAAPSVPYVLMWDGYNQRVIEIGEDAQAFAALDPAHAAAIRLGVQRAMSAWNNVLAPAGVWFEYSSNNWNRITPQHSPSMYHPLEERQGDVEQGDVDAPHRVNRFELVIDLDVFAQANQAGIPAEDLIQQIALHLLGHALVMRDNDDNGAAAPPSVMNTTMTGLMEPQDVDVMGAIESFGPFPEYADDGDTETDTIYNEALNASEPATGAAAAWAVAPNATMFDPVPEDEEQDEWDPNPPGHSWYGDVASDVGY